ncbi:MAG: polyprenyl synthetase family protein [Treponema sp.]|nr:polyprenyl synthetase family protein [Treponema sp.]
MNSLFIPYLEKIEQVIAEALPASSEQTWKDNTFGTLPDCITDDTFYPLVKPTRSLIDLGGKRWRPLFLVLCAESYIQSEGSSSNKILDSAYHLTPLVEFVHTASLIHDDIEDSSESRRNQPAAYITYGIDVAINAGSWLYFEAPVCIDTLDAPTETKLRLYKIYAKELRKLHLGQAMDITWHRNTSFCPSQEQYLSMVKNKTGTLASLAAKIGSSIAGAAAETYDKCGLIASEIGAGFQIIDDVINLTSGNPGKKRGDDIVENKKSLPVILFAEKYGTDSTEFKKLTSYFGEAKKSGIDSPAVEDAISLLETSGCIENARLKGIQLITDSCNALGNIFGTDNEGVKRINTLFKGMIPVSVIKN